MDALRRSPPFALSGWAWNHNSADTIRQGPRKAPTSSIVLKTNLSFNSICPFKILDVGPAPVSAIPDDRPLHDKVLHSVHPSDIPGRDSKHRASVRQGAWKGTDAIVLKTKLSLNWIGPFKTLAVGPAPASAIPDGWPLHDMLLYFVLHSDSHGCDFKHRASLLRCKPCRNPDDIHDVPKASYG